MLRFFSYDEQISHLIEKGLIIKDIEYAKKQLRHEGYYFLIEGYSDVFKNMSGNYKKGITFENIDALYTFDKHLKDIIYKYASQVECNFKSHIGYTFSMHHGIDPGNYLNAESFTHKQNTKRYVSLAIQRCKEIISVSTDYNNSRYREFMKNAKDKFGFVPFWVVVRALTFGNTSKFYKIMKDKEKQEIADNYGISHYELSNMIDIVIGFRNVVAHGERTYCVKLHRLRLNSNINIYNKLNIPRNVYGDPLFGRCDILSLLISFRYLLQYEDFVEFDEEFKKEIALLQKKIGINETALVLQQMGIKSGSWKNLVKIRLN